MVKTAVLIPNMAQYPAVSIRRYARELTRSLRNLHSTDWQFEELGCEHVEWAMRVIPGKAGEQMASRLARFVRYPALVRRTRGDIYHVLDHSHANLVWSSPAEKTVLTVHDIIPYLAAKGVIPLPAERFTRYSFPLIRIRAMHRCRHIITVSQASKQNLLEYAGLREDQVTVAYNGVNPVFRADPAPGEESVSAPEIRKRYGIPPDAAVMMHMGSAGIRYKNTPAVLRALSRLKDDPAFKERGGVYLLRAGAAFFDDESALAAELGLSDYIKFTGPIPGDVLLADHYRAADVFVFPSIWEGFGWPPLEAMACGTPVVTSNVSSLPEVVGDAGITVSPTDDAAFVAGIRQILTDDGLRCELRQRCLRQATKFTWEQCARTTLGVYNAIAS